MRGGREIRWRRDGVSWGIIKWENLRENRKRKKKVSERKRKKKKKRKVESGIWVDASESAMKLKKR
jgi:hypothetical protein